jgi:prepilin-type N-terminal cleavage/methylation domain-containing protein
MIFKKNNKKISEKGFSLVEIVFASAIISVILVAIMGVSSQSVSVSHRTLNTYNAALLLEEGAEAIRTYRDNSWSNISALATSTTYCPTFATSTNSWSFPVASSTCSFVNSYFTRSLTVSSVNRSSTSSNIISSGGVLDTGTKLITISVTWLEGAATTTKTLQLYLSDIFS